MRTDFWNDEEDAVLTRMWEANATTAEMCAALPGRSKGAVKGRAVTIGLGARNLRRRELGEEEMAVLACFADAARTGAPCPTYDDIVAITGGESKHVQYLTRRLRNAGAVSFEAHGRNRRVAIVPGVGRTGITDVDQSNGAGQYTDQGVRPDDGRAGKIFEHAGFTDAPVKQNPVRLHFARHTQVLTRVEGAW